MLLRLLLITGLVTALLAISFVAQAQPTAQVDVAWDPNPEPDLAGYVLKRGEAPGAWSLIEDVGLRSSSTASGLLPGRTYFWTVVAYNVEGWESLEADPVSWTVPSGAAITPITGWRVTRTLQRVSMRWDHHPADQVVGRWRIRYRLEGAATWVEASTLEPELEWPAEAGPYEVQITPEGLQGLGPTTTHRVPDMPRTPTSIMVRGDRVVWVWDPPAPAPGEVLPP